MKNQATPKPTTRSSTFNNPWPSLDSAKRHATAAPIAPRPAALGLLPLAQLLEMALGLLAVLLAEVVGVTLVLRS